MNIKVLGPGCANCRTLENRTREALTRLKAEATVEKVTDYTEILSYGIARTPGLIINNQIAVQGRVPTVDELVTLLQGKN